MTTARDSQRSRLYAAEVLAFTHTLVDISIGLDGLRTLGGILFHNPWWKSNTHGALPAIVAARANAKRSLAVSDPMGGWTLRIAPRHDQTPTLSHEAAHVLCGATHKASGPFPSHGPEFRSAHLAVVGLLMGSHGVGLLADAYRDAGLDWPETMPWGAGATGNDDEHGIFGRWRDAIAL